MSVHVPDRHSSARPTRDPVPPMTPPAPAPRRTTAEPTRQRRTRLIIVLVVGALVLGGVVALVAVLARSDTIGAGGHSYQEDFESSDVLFELFDDGDGRAFLQDGTLVLESSGRDILDHVQLGPMTSTSTEVDVAPGETSYAGPAIGGPDESGPGWYVAALVADSGEFFIVDSDHRQLSAARDVLLPGPWTRVSLSMEYSADRTVQLFSAVVMERSGPGDWVSVPGTAVSLTTPAREASTLYALVGPAGGPRNDDGTARTAHATFDNWSFTYDRLD